MKHELTLAYTDVYDFITGNDDTDIPQEEIDSEIERYQDELQNVLGDEFEVNINRHVIQDMYNGLPLYHASDEIRMNICNAQYFVTNNFW